jgi:hypothetical protein
MHSRLALIAAATIVVALAGCTGAPVEEPSASAPSTEPTANAATPSALVFTQPGDCAAGILPSTRLESLDDLGLTLLGGPGGKYGTEYSADPTPEEQLGGISCIWGFDESDISSITISVAPLSDDTRLQTLDEFATQGLVEQLTEDTAIYSQVGGDDEPSITNVLRDDSWISVLSTVGGEENAAESLVIADEVAAQVYAAP